MSWLTRSGFALVLLIGSFLPVYSSDHLVLAAAQGSRVVETTPTSLVFELDTPTPQASIVHADGREWQRLSLPGYDRVGKPGSPEQLQAGVLIGLPPTGDVTLRVLDAVVEELPGKWLLAPAPQLQAVRDPDSGELDAAAGVEAQFAWDAAAYAADEFLPASPVSIGNIGFIRSQRVAQVQLNPVQYNPVQGTVRVYRHLRVEATFSAAPASSQTAAPAAPDVFDPVLQAQLLNFDQARAWRVARPADAASPQMSPAVYPGDTSRPWFKTQLRSSGLYKITLLDLQAPALAPLAAANPAYLQVWKDGVEVRTYFLGDGDARFEADEALVFYAEINPTVYSVTDVYWVTVGDTPGLRMTAINAAPAAPLTDTSASAVVRMDEDMVYRGDLPLQNSGNTLPRWYWQELHTLFTPAMDVYIVLPGLINSGYTALVTVRAVGNTRTSAYPDHGLRVEVNGQIVGVMTWDDLNVSQKTFLIPATLLQPALNTVTLALEPQSGVTLDRLYPDWVEISYRRSLTAANDRLAFTAQDAGRRDYEATGFSGSDVLAFDVSNAAEPIRLTGLQVTPTEAPAALEPAVETPMAAAALLTEAHRVYLPLVGSPGAGGMGNASYRVRFGQTTNYSARYEMARVRGIRRIASLTQDDGSSLRQTTNRADYLLVSHRDLWPAAQALAAHRQSRGLTVALVDVQDIYDEFSNGRLDPRAIHDFVAYAYNEWQSPAPAYLMLLGGGHVDYRRRTVSGQQQPNLLPPYIACVDPWTCEVAVDNRFVTVSGNDVLPDLAVGRLPARTLASAMVMVNKIVSYENAPPSGVWRSTAVFVSDNAFQANGDPEPAGNFEALIEGAIAIAAPSLTIKRVYYDPYPNDDAGEGYRYRTPSQTTDAIVAAVNAGAVLLNYVGHAGTTTWAHEAILRMRDDGRNDATRFTNGGQLPISLDMACVSGNFADLTFTGLEVMMLSWQQGGTVAGWGATGFGVATGHDRLHQGFYTAVFNNQVRVLGLAALAGKQSLWAANHDLDLLDTFGLLGDPALRINWQPR